MALSYDSNSLIGIKLAAKLMIFLDQSQIERNRLAPTSCVAAVKFPLNSH